MQKPSCVTYVAKIDGNFAGRIITEVIPNDLGAFDIAVSPRYFKRGVGSALLVTGLNSLFSRGVKRAIADFMIMSVATYNFYESHGFKLERA